MFSSKNTLIASLALCGLVVGAKMAQAEGFKFGGGSGNNGNSKSSFKINFSGNSGGHSQFKNGSSFKKYDSCHHDHYDHHHHHHVRYIEPVRLVYSQCYHPEFRGCYVFPGDTWYSISKRVYGVEFLCKHIAAYNGLSMGSPLVPGQLLRLPVVNANGSLAVSNAPMPAPFAPQGAPFAAQGSLPGPPSAMIGPQGSPMAPQGMPNGVNAGAPQGLPNGMNAASSAPQAPSIPPLEATFTAPKADAAPNATPAASIRSVTEEPTLPRVATGTTLTLDGKSLGPEKGIVRLQMGGLILPVEVIEWTETSVKIALPKMELSRPVKASLEVLRADGSLASKSEIELTPAATRLALGN
jgi:hypothetical protein